MTNLTTIVSLYLHPEDRWITGRNMLVKILWIKLDHNIKVDLFVVYIFYK